MSSSSRPLLNFKCREEAANLLSLSKAFEILLPGSCHQFGSNKCLENSLHGCMFLMLTTSRNSLNLSDHRKGEMEKKEIKFHGWTILQRSTAWSLKGCHQPSQCLSWAHVALQAGPQGTQVAHSNLSPPTRSVRVSPQALSSSSRSLWWKLTSFSYPPTRGNKHAPLITFV